MSVESLVVSAGRPHEPGAPLNPPIVLDGAVPQRPVGQPLLARAPDRDARRARSRRSANSTAGHALAFASGMAAIAAVAEGQPTGTVAVVPHAAYSGAVSIFANEQAPRPHDRAAGRHRRHRRGARRARRRRPAVARGSDESVAVGARSAAADRCRARGGSDRLRRRDVCDTAERAPARTRRRHRHALGDEVPRGTFGPAARRARHPLVRTARAAGESRRTLTGAIPGALESYLALRGLRTLALRMERAQANALDLAQRLAAHPRVARVRYPGLPSDPFHEVAVAGARTATAR